MRPAIGTPGRNGADSRFQGLDALRGVAAMSVLLYHYTSEYGAKVGHTRPLIWSFPHGHYGVSLFFMISGFVIFMTLERVERVADFAVARIGRLYPAFFCALALTTLVLLLSGLPMFKPTLWQIIVNVTMAPRIFGVECVDGSYWTLAVELVFYLYASLFFLWSTPRNTEKWCVAWLGLSMGAWITSTIGQRFPRMAADAGLLKEFLLSGYEYQFIIGIMLYRIVSKEARPISYAILALCLFLATRIRIEDAISLPTSGALNSAIVLFFTCLLWIGITDRLPSFLMPMLLFLGEISYSLYLIHQQIGYAIIHRLEAWGIGPESAVLATIPPITLLAWGMRRYVEVPAQRKIRSLYAAYRSRQLATEAA